MNQPEPFEPSNHLNHPNHCSLREPQNLRPEEYQHQLDSLMAAYQELQERTEAIENVNHEGGKYIREAKV